MSDPQEKKVRMIVCTRCGTSCRATLQDVQEERLGVVDILRARGWNILGALLGVMLQDGVEAHTAPCGLPCGEAQHDGVARHAGPDCAACARRRGTVR